MSRVRRRKGNRTPARGNIPIVVYVYEQRLEGRVLDRSDHGIGVILPSDCGLIEQKTVRILYERRQQMAKVARVVPTDEGDQVGLRLLS